MHKTIRLLLKDKNRQSISTDRRVPSKVVLTQMSLEQRLQGQDPERVQHRYDTMAHQNGRCDSGAIAKCCHRRAETQVTFQDMITIEIFSKFLQFFKQRS